jgi:hypothetical protein
LWHDVWHETQAPLAPPELTDLRTLGSFRERLQAAFSDIRVAGPRDRRSPRRRRISPASPQHLNGRARKILIRETACHAALGNTLSELKASRA